EQRFIEAGDLCLDLQRHEALVGGRAVELTAKEFDLLACFARSPGRVFTRAQLLDQVWGYTHSGYEHTVNSHINRLRSKIERDPANPDYVQTVWGVGYKFADRRGCHGFDAAAHAPPARPAPGPRGRPRPACA